MKKGWKYKKLGDIALDMYRGSGIKRDQVTVEGIPCLRYGEIYTSYNIAFDKCVSHTDESLIPSKKYFEHGDVIFAITGESVEDIGKSIAYLGHEKCLLGGDTVAMKHNQNPKYLAYALSTPSAIKQKGYGKTKLKVVHTNVPSLKEIQIPVPPLSEQQQIVTYLDAAFEKIDAIKTNAEKSLSEAKALFQSALKEMMKPKEGWEEKTISECCKLLRGSSPRPIKKFITTSDDGVNWIKIGDTTIGEKYVYRTKEKITKEGAEKSRFVEEGDFILSNSMSFGRPYIMKTNGCIHDGWFVLKDYQEFFTTDMFYYVLSSPIVTDQFYGNATGSTVQNICSDIVNKVIIPVPPLSTQHSIVATLDALSAKVSALEANYTKTISECAALKQAILREVFE